MQLQLFMDRLYDLIYRFLGSFWAIKDLYRVRDLNIKIGAKDYFLHCIYENFYFYYTQNMLYQNTHILGLIVIYKQKTKTFGSKYPIIYP